ncbi:MAG: sugar phosphate isomerase/epimerase [Oscillospiraceae bacterium]
MKLGIISPDFKLGSFEKIKSMGLDFIEFCINSDTENRYQEFYDEADNINTALKKLGLFVGSVGRWGADKICKDGSHNAKELIADETLIKAASKLGCPVYVTNCNYVDEISLYENYTAAITYFKKLIELGNQYNIKIATNNCRWNNYVTCDPAWSVVHGQLKELFIKFDPSHSVYAGGDYLSEMKKWGNRFAHVHIKGSLVIEGERFDDPPAGLDQTNWGAFMATLYAVGYDGTLSIEPHSSIWRDELGDKGVEYTIKLIRSFMFQ